MTKKTLKEYSPVGETGVLMNPVLQKPTANTNGLSEEEVKAFFLAVREQIATLTRDGLPPFAIEHAYLGDLSFENPDAPSFFLDREFERTAGKRQGRLDINVELHKVGDSFYEDIINTRLLLEFSKRSKPLMLVELRYHMLVRLHPRLANESALFALHCEVPRLAFPFIQRILFDLAREGAVPPPQLKSFDFQSLFLRHVQEFGLPDLDVKKTAAMSTDD